MRFADSGRRTQAMNLLGVWNNGRLEEALVGEEVVVGVAVPESG